MDNGPLDERDGEPEWLSEMLEAPGAGMDAMTVGEMDGFVAGLALFPERVGHCEWLPHVLGSEPRFDSPEEAAAVEAVQAIETLYAAANGASTLAGEGLELLDSMGPAMIAGIVRDLNASGVSGIAAGELARNGSREVRYGNRRRNG